MPWQIRNTVSSLRQKLSGVSDEINVPEDSARVSTKRSSPPPPPQELLANRETYEIPLLDRRIDGRLDHPIAALYRIYEHLILDQHIELRNEFEAFWYHNTWLICDLTDPRDLDAQRYACLACIAALLCTAFNRRIGLGLPRDAPPIFTHEMLDEWRAQERRIEEAPQWASAVPAVSDTLSIPHWDNDVRDFVTLTGFEDPSCSKEFAAKNILIRQPHIHFI